MSMVFWRMRRIASSVAWMKYSKLRSSPPSMTCSSTVSRRALLAGAPPRWFDFLTQSLHIEPSLSQYRCGLRYQRHIRHFRLSWHPRQCSWSFKVPCIGTRPHHLHAKNITVLFLKISKSRVKTSSESTKDVDIWVSRFEGSRCHRS